jgi:hemerythrin superfamily protein
MPKDSNSQSKKSKESSKAGANARPNKTGQPARTRHATEAVDALTLLEADHREVDDLFDAFEEASGDAEQRDIARSICVALKVHARLEEELFYPAVWPALEDKSLIAEAMVEHASARDLIAQIESGAPGEAFFSARVRVLGEYVRHHVEEEEEEIFPQVRKGKLDLAALGELLTRRKAELMTGFAVSNPVLALS